MKSQSRTRLLMLLYAMLLLPLVAACATFSTQVGALQSQSETVELGVATEAEVDIRMNAGRLNIEGGADPLFEGEFRYNVADWRPEVTYEVQGESGQLRVTQPELDGLNIGETENTWDLQFNNQVPIEMDITLGAGESDLALTDLNLQRLNLQTGAGTAVLAVAGNLSALVVETGAGGVNLDLTGEWMQDLDAQIQAGVSQISVLLPADVGVRVAIEQGLGQINAPSLSQEGDYLVNEAYGESENTLSLNITGGVGEINLEVED